MLFMLLGQNKASLVFARLLSSHILLVFSKSEQRRFMEYDLLIKLIFINIYMYTVKGS